MFLRQICLRQKFCTPKNALFYAKKLCLRENYFYAKKRFLSQKAFLRQNFFMAKLFYDNFHKNIS